MTHDPAAQGRDEALREQIVVALVGSGVIYHQAEYASDAVLSGAETGTRCTGARDCPAETHIHGCFASGAETGRDEGAPPDPGGCTDDPVDCAHHKHTLTEAPDEGADR